MVYHTSPKFKFFFRLLSFLSILLSLEQSLATEEPPKKKLKTSTESNKESSKFKRKRYNAFCGEFNNLEKITKSNKIRIGVEVELRSLSNEAKGKVVNYFHQQKNMGGQLTKYDIREALFYNIENADKEEPLCEDRQEVPERLKKNKLFEIIQDYSGIFSKNNLTIHDLEQIIISDEDKSEYKIDNHVSIYNKDESFEKSIAIHFDNIFPEITTSNRQYVLSISNGIDHVRSIYKKLGLDLSPHEKAHLIDANNDDQRMTSLHLHFSFSPNYENLLNKNPSSNASKKESSSTPKSVPKLAEIAHQINALHSISALYNSCISNKGTLLTKPLVSSREIGRFNVDTSFRGIIRSPIRMLKEELEDTDTYPQAYKFDRTAIYDDFDVVEDPYRIEIRRFVGNYEDDLIILGCMAHELMEEDNYEKTKKKILTFVDEIIRSLETKYSSCLKNIEGPFLSFKAYVNELKMK